MLRRIVLTLLFAAIAAGAAAQRPRARVEWGVVGGINIPDYTTNMSETDVKNKLGWQAGITTAVNLGAFAIEPQILYVRQGLRIRPEGGSEINLKSNSIDVPVLASLRLLNPVRIYAGPVFQNQYGRILENGAGNADAPPADRPALQRPVPLETRRGAARRAAARQTPYV